MGTPAYPTTYRVNVRIVGPRGPPVGLAATVAVCAGACVDNPCRRGVRREWLAPWEPWRVNVEESRSEPRSVHSWIGNDVMDRL